MAGNRLRGQSEEGGEAASAWKKGRRLQKVVCCEEKRGQVIAGEMGGRKLDGFGRAATMAAIDTLCTRRQIWTWTHGQYPRKRREEVAMSSA